MKRELDKYGIQMPAFSKIGGILANELSVDEAAGMWSHVLGLSTVKWRGLYFKIFLYFSMEKNTGLSFWVIDLSLNKLLCFTHAERQMNAYLYLKHSITHLTVWRL